MARMDGKVAIITGAARGMGFSCAERFVDEGASVVIADVLADEAEAAADKLGPQARATAVDVRREDDWARLVEFTAAEFGPPSVLVNNAGIVARSPLLQTSEADYRRVVDVNQVGVFLGMKAVVPAMLEAGGGSIVNVASVEGLVGSPRVIAYTASKHAVVGMTKVAALELATLGVRVNGVAPGGIDTPLIDDLRSSGLDPAELLAATTPMARIGRPDEIAAVVLFLASDESSYCTGATFNVDGGWLAR